MTARAHALRQAPHMDARIEAARTMLRSCVLCEHRCAVDRTRFADGRCGCGTDSRAYFEDLLWGEEEFITPTYAVFFAGCNLGCEFCYASDRSSHPTSNPRVDPDGIASRVRTTSTST